MKIVVLSQIAVATVFALDNGVGKKPAMGWNSWNKFACDVTEQNMKDAAKQILDLGFYELGYNYINIDDCWNLKERTSDGH